MAATKTRASKDARAPAARGAAARQSGTHRMCLVLGIEIKHLGSFMMAKRPTKKAAFKKSAAKRELIAPRGDKRYIRRDAAGRIKESDDVSRSLSQDRRRKAKTAAKPGQGDRGDRKTASKTTSRKKSSAQR